MFSTLTERNNILKPKALIHIFNTCQLRIFCFTWPISTTRAKNRSLYVCYWYLLFIRIRNWNNSIWRTRTDLWSSKTEICHESNKAEIKDKLWSFKMASTKRLLENLPENLNLAIDFWSRCQSITEMYEIRTNERVLTDRLDFVNYSNVDFHDFHVHKYPYLRGFALPYKKAKAH